MRATGTLVAMARDTDRGRWTDGWLQIDKERIYNYLYLCGHTVLTQLQIIGLAGDETKHVAE